MMRKLGTMLQSELEQARGCGGALRYECFAGVERRLRLGRREKCVVPGQGGQGA